MLKDFITLMYIYYIKRYTFCQNFLILVIYLYNRYNCMIYFNLILYMKYLIKNKDITNLSNFKTPAEAKFYFEIKTINDLDKLYEIEKFAKSNNYDVLYIWWWTNLLFAFDTYNWIVVKNMLNWWKYDKNSKFLESYTNDSISDIAQSLESDFSQSLWHRFIWLPGSIWWAVFWNAGCFWLEIENNFLEAEVINLDNGQIEVLDKFKMQFEYRNTIMKKKNRYFIVKVKFDLSKKIEKYHSDIDNIDFRDNKQPKGNSCWSFFKNPSKEQSAGFLIEKVWLKWYNKWGAFFSELHSNFLMSDWSASYKDLLNLINIAKEKVKKNFSIDLVPEVRIINN